MKPAACLILSLFALYNAHAQFSRYIISFTDKKGGGFQLSDPSQFLSQKAIARRTKQHISIDSSDLPVSVVYIDSIKNISGVTLLNQSKWFNQVLVKLQDSTSLNKILAFPFVKKIAPAALHDETQIPKEKRTEVYTSNRKWVNEGQKNVAAVSSLNGINGNVYNYGSSFAQIHIHAGEFLHDKLFNGAGITIAILDGGFYHYLNNPAFDSVRNENHILGTWDYVHNKQSVNEENDHGANCFSIIAANLPGQFVGSAPGAAFWLLKTEDVSSEFPVEEQNWVAAAEFADSAGADMISTSLGYDYFDSAVFNHTYAERDGHTTLITKAANTAVAKGMIVTVSAGNSGDNADESRYIACPADADSVLAVGAVNASGVLAGFSSRGPNASGQVKPDVVSVGQATVFVAADGTVVSGNGTSFSNPNLAGLIACLWQAFPNNTAREIMNAVLQSSDRYSSPDNGYGYGIPNFEKAYAILETKNNNALFAATLKDDWIKVYPIPFNDAFTVLFKASANDNTEMELLSISGQLIERKTLNVQSDLFYPVPFLNMNGLAKGVYYLRCREGGKEKVLRLLKR